MKMAMVGLVWIAALGLAGCATYSETQARPAEYAAKTAKSPQQFSACVLAKMVDVNAASHIIADGNARTVIVPVGGGTPDAVLITISAVTHDGITRVEMRHMRSLSDFHKQWQQVQSCL